MLPKTWKFPYLMKDSKFETYMPSFFKELVSMYEAIVKELSPLDEELLTWNPGSIADGDSGSPRPRTALDCGRHRLLGRYPP